MGRLSARHALFLSAAIGALAVSGVTAARAQETLTLLDTITITATKMLGSAIEALAAMSVVDKETQERIAADTPAEMFQSVPGVTAGSNGNDPATSINVRGLQDFGRVAVTVDGARQNFQRTGHNANGMFYLEPEVIEQTTVIRGPVANVFGSGAIGGVVNFETISPATFLREGERWALSEKLLYESSGEGFLTSTIGAAQLAAGFGVLGNIVYRTNGNFEDGDGVEIGDSARDIVTGLGKAVFNPAEGHEVTLSGLLYDNSYITGTVGSTTRYDTSVTNTTTVARWTYSRPEDWLLDFDVSAYWNETAQEQVRIGTGAERSFQIDTTGFDAHNTSRFDTGAVAHALTYGVDYFTDTVDSEDPASTTDLFTPDGERTVYGGFLQLESDVTDWLEVIAAARYDAYSLEGTDVTTGDAVSNEGDRISPKLTVGVTPLEGVTFYGTYAEGYRAPAVTETLISGAHPGPALFDCDGDTTPDNLFCFAPNPNLRPEVGKTKEVGVNLAFDEVLQPGDSFRLKGAIYQNDVEDYIEGIEYGSIQYYYSVPVYQYYQYQNVASARLRGAEIEATYDMGWMFLGLAGSVIRGEDLTEGDPLGGVPADKLAATVGFRALENKLMLGGTVIGVAAQDRVPTDGTESEAYTLVNLFASYQATEDLRFGASVENLFDETYRPYLDQTNGKGLTFKLSVTGRIGG